MGHTCGSSAHCVLHQPLSMLISSASPHLSAAWEVTRLSLSLPDSQPLPVCSSAVPELADLPRGGGGSAADAFDSEMVRAEVRAVVEEEVRLEVDEDMRRMIANIKVGLCSTWCCMCGHQVNSLNVNSKSWSSWAGEHVAQDCHHQGGGCSSFYVFAALRWAVRSL